MVYAVVRLEPGRHTGRRLLVVITDLGALSVPVHLLGVEGVALYPIYLWIIVGNGLRYGVSYLVVATGVGITGFTVATMLNPFWAAHPTVMVGAIAGMVVLPAFYAGMLSRLHDGRLQLEAQVEKTSYAANHDALTGLPNRAHLMERVHRETSSATRSSGACALIFMDLDGFKQVNDAHGHDCGDRLLISAARCIRGCVREIDVTGRFGGDEFVIFAPTLPDTDDAAMMAQRLLEQFHKPFSFNGRSLPLTASIGVAVCTRCDGDPETLLRAADNAMYSAKRAGGTRWARAPDVTSESLVDVPGGEHGMGGP